MSDSLTPQQEYFCRLYTTKGDTFSNATLSYAEAYQYELPKDEKDKLILDSKEYNICASNGSRLLTNDKIIARNIRLLNDSFNDDAVADARLNEILIGGKDTDSIQAIKERNSLKQRITKKLDITSAGRPLASVSDDELDKLANS